MEEYKNIYRALLTIKSICVKHQTCYMCPLRHPERYYDCGLTDGTPESWELTEPSEWKAFKKMITYDEVF